jgi:hypothetical protein
VKLQSGGVAVFSPVALTPEVKEIVAALGEVKYITALDFEVSRCRNAQPLVAQAHVMQHHLKIGEWYKEYPNAKVLGPEGLPEKRANQKNEDVPFSVVFTAKDKAATKVDPEFDADFDYEYVDGHRNKELVFNYKPDKTLIEADLLFNLPATEQFGKSGESPTSGFLTRLFVALNSTAGDATWHKRFIWYATSSSNRPSFNQSVARIATWDFNRIIPCHGEVIEEDGKGIFNKIFQWHLEATKKGQ